MSPSDLKLAKQECQELLRQGLIEHTTSNWACPDFYVEKRSERLRGKKRLVVDYKPLNHFLKDDKFPLPKASTLPILLKESKIFSKFDLKSGFWQLGVDPSERHKIAFCIPNAQYQWTVLPFGLKVAPSLFQKAITKILEPLLDNAIIYIDDIILFSKDMESHKKLFKPIPGKSKLVWYHVFRKEDTVSPTGN
uniref:Polyprotein n=2 Tax=Cajanus cajan TaxID=3821 RepID=A0A151UAE9_CAJCA|nr:polyprotein [Cajanus cajan]